LLENFPITDKSDEETSGSDMEKSVRKLLLVDDNPDILYSIKLGLERRNFSPDAFSKPREALSAFSAGKYDFALLDIDMPEMNGFELCRELLMRDPNLKICFFTAFENYREQFRKEFPEIKSDCFLRKPMSINELAFQINKFLDSEHPSLECEENSPSIAERIPKKF
jgi:DNA-binding response OmpR family regulator